MYNLFKPSAKLILTAFLLFSYNPFTAMGQLKVKFTAPDSLLITADYYKIDETNPYIILFHQAGSSRGEYRDIATKLTNLGYNCLAVDLRSGNKMNFIENETAGRAKERNLATSYLDAEQDMHAAIDYVYEKSGQEVILFGSSYSASLSLKIANETSKVKAVVAFSPGEYFNADLIVKDQLRDFNKPVFIASTKKEAEYMDELTTHIADKYKTLFKPTHGDGVHGARALWNSNSSSEEYWLALLMFFSELKSQ